MEKPLSKPVYFEMDGKYAVMLPIKGGGTRIIKDPNSPNIADFMMYARQIQRTDLPKDFLEDVDSVSDL